MNRYQDLSTFSMPTGFRGRSKWIVQAWWIVEKILFQSSPQGLYGWRVFLLRSFGARIGKNVIIRPSVSVTYPWNLSVGDFSWIGDDVVLYTLGKIIIGNHTVVSQRTYLCAGSHDYAQVTFPITGCPIVIDDQCWLATDVFVAPGVTIGFGTVVAARSTVTRNLPGGVIAMGSPAKAVKDRRYQD